MSPISRMALLPALATLPHLLLGSPSWPQLLVGVAAGATARPSVCVPWGTLATCTFLTWHAVICRS